MTQSTVLLFTRNGMGDGPVELQQTLVEKFLALTLVSGVYPNRIIFYTDGVKLVCEGSRVIKQLVELESKGVELVICKTCLDTYDIAEKVKVGIIGGMPDILETLQKADKVVSL